MIIYVHETSLVSGVTSRDIDLIWRSAPFNILVNSRVAPPFRTTLVFAVLITLLSNNRLWTSSTSSCGQRRQSRLWASSITKLWTTCGRTIQCCGRKIWDCNQLFPTIFDPLHDFKTSRFSSCLNLTLRFQRSQSLPTPRVEPRSASLGPERPSRSESRLPLRNSSKDH